MSPPAAAVDADRAGGPVAPPRRTQAQRSDATRALLLDATRDLLVEVGYARTTTQAVADRAGVSRGAQLHHFPTRGDLVVEAVRRLSTERRQAVEAAGPATGLDQLAALFSGPLFLAALELVVAARADPELRATVVPFEAEVVRDTRALAGRVLGLDPTSPRGRDVVDLTLDLLRGMGVAALLGDPHDHVRRRDRLLTAWRALLGLETTTS